MTEYSYEILSNATYDKITIFTSEQYLNDVPKWFITVKRNDEIVKTVMYDNKLGMLSAYNALVQFIDAF